MSDFDLDEFLVETIEDRLARLLTALDVIWQRSDSEGIYGDWDDCRLYFGTALDSLLLNLSMLWDGRLHNNPIARSEALEAVNHWNCNRWLPRAFFIDRPHCLVLGADLVVPAQPWVSDDWLRTNILEFVDACAHLVDFYGERLAEYDMGPAD